jgi:hypothetical protein
MMMRYHRGLFLTRDKDKVIADWPTAGKVE